MTTKSFSTRLAALERLEAGQRPALPVFVCLHQADAAALDDVTTPAELRAQIVAAYQLGGEQKMYIGLCMCDWDGDGRTCRVCADRPVVQEF